MESEPRVPTSRVPPQFSWVNLSRNLILSYQSFRVVYGDLSTPPLYVYTSTFGGKLQKHINEETIFGAFSLIFWTLTLIPLLKCIFIVLSADDNGEGGTFALYTLLCRHAKFSLLPNQQADDEQLSSHDTSQADAPSPRKKFLDNHIRRKSREGLLIVVLLGACMVIGDGVLTPAMSVLASVSRLRVVQKTLPQELVLLACIILVGLFSLQHYGTHKVAFIFASIPVIWLASIFSVGLYNTIFWNPKIVNAMSPRYIFKFFSKTGFDGWSSLGGILLCSAGSEAMFADLGHFTASSIRLALAAVAYPCLVVQYMGQAAFLSKNLQCIPNSFCDSIPELVFWPAFVIATLAPIAGSQALITATSSIIKQCNAYGCFPRQSCAYLKTYIWADLHPGSKPDLDSCFNYWISRHNLNWKCLWCIVRYGYKDIRSDDGDFETLLIQSIAEFIIVEATKSQFIDDDETCSLGEIISSGSCTSLSSPSLVSLVAEDDGVDIIFGGSLKQHSLESGDERLKPEKFKMPHNPEMDPAVKEELSDLVEAKECGVTYIMGHTEVKARRSLSFLKKVVINMGYSFLCRNCRGPAVAVNIPHVSLNEVGMIYYV